MIKIIGRRCSGKTTELLKIAQRDGYVIIEPNIRMANHVKQMAKEKGLTDVKIISAHELQYNKHVIDKEKYLVDELEMFLLSLGIYGYSNCLYEPSDDV